MFSYKYTVKTKNSANMYKFVDSFRIFVHYAYV